MATKDEKTGRFTKVLKIWDGTNHNEGWYDNKGRFRVYRPDYPRAFKGGYALRAWIVWWLYHGNCHPTGTNLHHKNGIKDDDRIDNLEIIEHATHSRIHHLKPSTDIILVCEYCKSEFTVKLHRIKSRQKAGQETIRFCSQKCFHSSGRSEESKTKLSNSLKLAYKEGRKKTRLGTKQSEETKSKISLANKGRKLTEEQKAKLRKPKKRK